MRSTPSDALPPARLSPKLRAERWVVCGRFGRPHGVRGDIRLWVYNQQSQLIDVGEPLYLAPHPQHVDQEPDQPLSSLTVSHVRTDNKGLLIRFAELSTREDVQRLNHLAWISPRGGFPDLSEDEFYLIDLIGAEGYAIPTGASEVEDPRNQEDAIHLGQLTGMLEAGSSELLVFEGSDLGEIMVPNIEEFVVEINLEERYVKIRAVPGLLEGGI